MKYTITILLLFATLLSAFDKDDLLLLKKEGDCVGCDLRDANLSGIYLEGSDLSEADLRGANLKNADLMYSNFYGANLKGADLYQANARGADFSYANLTDANCSSMVFKKTKLVGTKFIKTDLSHARMWHLDLRKSSIKKCNFSEAMIGSSEVDMKKLKNSSLTGIIFWKDSGVK